MSLVGFKAQNHHQQTSKRGPRPEVDNLETPWEFFTPLHERFRFTIDVAALPHNAKRPCFYSPDEDGLAQSWVGERVWCNPPYSDIEPWVAKAHTAGAELVVMLVPANRCEQGWWQRQVEPYRDRAVHCGFCGASEWPHPAGALGEALPLRVEFLPGRLRFIKHGHDRVEPNQRPPFGCALLIWGDQHREQPANGAPDPGVSLPSEQEAAS